MSLHRGAGDGEAQAIALLLSRAFAARERREQARPRFGRKPFAAVDHADQRFVAVAHQCDRCVGVRGRMLQRVADHVLECALQQFAVAFDDRRPSLLLVPVLEMQRPRLAGDFQPRIVDDFRQQFAQVDRGAG